MERTRPSGRSARLLLVASTPRQRGGYGRRQLGGYGRPRGFFEPAQLEAVRAHLPAPLRPVVTLAYLTGWRLTSEVLPLEWRQVDWTRRVVRLDPGTTRNRDGRTFPP